MDELEKLYLSQKKAFLQKGFPQDFVTSDP
jgi:hypothetical protein